MLFTEKEREEIVASVRPVAQMAARKILEALEAKIPAKIKPLKEGASEEDIVAKINEIVAFLNH
jgi:hypothetical protein